MLRDEKIENLRILDELSSAEKSKLRKYQDLIIGRRGILPLLKYEAIVTVTAWVPGALGLFLRGKLYPLLLGRVGKGVHFGTNVVLRHPHKIALGDHVTIDDNCLLDAKGTDNRGIVIGSNVFIARNSTLFCKNGDISIGDNVSIGVDCTVFSANVVKLASGVRVAMQSLLNGGTHAVENEDIPHWQQRRSGRGITLGENVWLGANTKVLDGVTIGESAVIGAGAVVNKDIGPYALAVGVPARVIRDRQSSDTDVGRSGIETRLAT